MPINIPSCYRPKRYKDEKNIDNAAKKNKKAIISMIQPPIS